VSKAAQAEGKVHARSPARLRFAIVALAAVPLSASLEYVYLAKRNPFSPAEILSAIEFFNRLVFK
jgi:TetR/AcrR family transcriptional regulator